MRNHRKERRKRVIMVMRNITKMLVGGGLGGGGDDEVGVGVGVNTPAQSNSSTREGAGGLYASIRAWIRFRWTLSQFMARSVA